MRKQDYKFFMINVVFIPNKYSLIGNYFVIFTICQ
jgi:hypothetical protein